MAIIDDDRYRPKGLWRNGHINSFGTHFFRRLSFEYQHEEWTMADGDPVVISTAKKSHHKNAAILIHGVEGTSDSTYMIGMARVLLQLGYDIYSTNMRGCRIDPSRVSRFYHGGFTDDLEHIVDRVSPLYNKIVLVGFSLGGNVMMNYLGRNKTNRPENMATCIGISVPFDLLLTANHLDQTIYRRYFLPSLRRKAIALINRDPGRYGELNVKSINTLRSYDDVVTAPMNGFIDAEDYYRRASWGHVLSAIDTDVLIVNAWDDPFFPNSQFPLHQLSNHAHITFYRTMYGGHVGFWDGRKDSSFAEQVVVEWLTT